MIGILSFSSNNIIPTYSTDNEIKCFDFYCSYDNKIYINGKLHRPERKMRQNNLNKCYIIHISNIEMWLLPFLVKQF
jgi:hypothetical protein